MKKLIVMAAILLPLQALAQQGTISYFLPRTTVIFDVTARQEVFHAGPYAKFAQKYLGIAARQEDSMTYELRSVRVSTSTEADPSACFAASMDTPSLDRLLTLSTQGLVSLVGNTSAADDEWSFPLSSDGGFEEKGIPSNLATESTSLQKKGEGTVQQSVVVEKSLEMKAKEVADLIFEMRDKRFKILVGDTDATYSGEAMKAAVDALQQMENDYLSLFFGYSEYQEQAAVFRVIPDPAASSQFYVPFRISDTEGLVDSGNVSGKPVYLELVPETVAAASPSDSRSGKPKYEIIYRIPAVCAVKLSDGVKTILQTRIPVYQLGTNLVYPINK